MKLEELLKELEYQCVQGSVDREIRAVVNDSRRIIPDCLFLCIEGAVYDGHRFAVSAAKAGAVALIVSKEVDPDIAETDAAVIRVQDTREAMALISAAWFGYPAKKLKTIGITGTKGKTTTAYLVRSVLENAGIRCGLIGTIETIIGEEAVPAVNTTPESYLLQETFAKMVDAGMEAVVMEVSSQALMLHRTQGILFDYGIFTNLEPDHIGANEHASFEEYLACKSLLFRQCRVGIVNGDDAHVEKILEGHTCEVETYGLDEKNQLRAEEIRRVYLPGALGVDFETKGLTELSVKLPMPGKFSVYNGLCAISICRHFGIRESDICRAFRDAKVKGRIERVDVSDKFIVLIDYAHNAMALESLLTTLREYHPHRLVSLFGCGGNRSKLRRYEMGEVSGRIADLTIITSDNPRFEKPQDIIADIRVGMERTGGSYIAICDRKEAIAYALSHAEEGDIIVLAGKGHEDYQEIGGKKYPMDERTLIRELLDGGLKII